MGINPKPTLTKDECTAEKGKFTVVNATEAFESKFTDNLSENRMYALISYAPVEDESSAGSIKTNASLCER